MKIAIIGAGYVGLVTAACLSEFGFDVTCVEREKRKIDQLLAGEVPFYEPGLAKTRHQQRRGRPAQVHGPYP
jgi:UDPglucose 6-dehydrogenase